MQSSIATVNAPTRASQVPIEPGRTASGRLDRSRAGKPVKQPIVWRLFKRIGGGDYLLAADRARGSCRDLEHSPVQRRWTEFRAKG